MEAEPARDPDAARPGLDLVTVVFSAEVDLLRLQARSIDLFLDPAAVDRIFVLVNDRHEDACVERVADMLPEYGRFASQVEVLRPDPLFEARATRSRPLDLRTRLRHAATRHRGLWPFGVREGWRGNRGWRVQQALKLVASDHGDSPYLLLLDAKNHFLRPVTLESFVSAAGKPKSWLGAPGRQQVSWIEASFDLLGVPLPATLESVPPTVTPYCVSRAVLASCLAAVEERVGPIETFFARRWSRASEFMLIYAHVLGRQGDWYSAFDPGLIPAATIYRDSSPARTDRILTEVEDGTCETFSIHGSHLAALGPDQRRRVEAIWKDRGLLVPEVLARMREHAAS